MFFEISPYNVSMFNKTDKETIVNNSLSLALNYQGNQIRTAGTRENPLFCAKDVCDILGIKNTSQALLKVDKDAIRISYTIDGIGRTQPYSFVTESGVYELTFKSRKKEALAFQRWVTNEVLPSIRKTGSYSVQPPTTLDLFNLSLAVFNEHQERIGMLEIKQIDLVKKVEQLEQSTQDIVYYTVTAFQKLKKITLNTSETLRLGCRTSKLCKEQKVSIGTAPHQRWGTVNTYPLEFLELAYEELFGEQKK